MKDLVVLVDDSEEKITSRYEYKLTRNYDFENNRNIFLYPKKPFRCEHQMKICLKHLVTVHFHLSTKLICINFPLNTY